MCACLGESQSSKSCSPLATLKSFHQGQLHCLLFLGTPEKKLFASPQENLALTIPSGRFPWVFTNGFPLFGDGRGTYLTLCPIRPARPPLRFRPFLMFIFLVRLFFCSTPFVTSPFPHNSLPDPGVCHDPRCPSLCGFLSIFFCSCLGWCSFHCPPHFSLNNVALVIFFFGCFESRSFPSASRAT